MMTLYWKSRRAFTLIELLVVIAIIGLLAGLMFPVISRVKEKGMSTHCRNNLRQLGIAARVYADDHEGRLPSIKSADGTVDGIPVKNREIREILRQAAGSDEVFQCRKDQSEHVRNGGSSYEWNRAWNGKLIDRFRPGEPVLNDPWTFDAEPWHQGAGGKGGRNAVFMDGRVAAY
jgi:prepilin-type N-terminal cleavage/methylation domain-containing protein